MSPITYSCNFGQNIPLGLLDCKNIKLGGGGIVGDSFGRHVAKGLVHYLMSTTVLSILITGTMLT